MSTPRAADLPVGSVVAARFDPSEYVGGETFHPAGERHIVYLRQDLGTVFGTFRWMAGVQGVSEQEVQKALDGGAQVLRVGDGNASAGSRHS